MKYDLKSKTNILHYVNFLWKAVCFWGISQNKSKVKPVTDWPSELQTENTSNLTMLILDDGHRGPYLLKLFFDLNRGWGSGWVLHGSGSDPRKQPESGSGFYLTLT